MSEMTNKTKWDLLAVSLPAFTYFYTIGAVSFWLPLWAEDLGWKYSYITWMSTAFFIAMTPSVFLSGVLADYTRKPGAILGTGLLLNAFSVATILLSENPVIVIPMRGLQGLGLAPTIPIALGSLTLIAGPARGSALTLLSSATGMAAGAVVGGLLIQYSGYYATFMSAVLLSVVSAAISYTYQYPLPPKAPSILEAAKKIPKQVYIILTALAIRNFFASGVFSIFAIIFRTIIGLNITATGLALAANPVTQSISSQIAPRISRGREIVTYSIGIAATGLVFYLYLYAYNIQTALLAQILLGFTYALIMVPGNTYIVSKSPIEIRYTASSLYGLAFNIGWIIGSAISGVYMDIYSPESWIKLSSIGVLLPALIALTALIPEKKQEQL